MEACKRHGLLGVALAMVLGLGAPNVLAQYYKYPHLEAECPDTFSGNYGTRQTSITGSSSGGYVRSAGNTTAAEYNSTSVDRATYNFALKGLGTYVVWFRINTNNSGADDSLYYRLDSGYWNTLTNVPAGSGWRWVQAGGLFPSGQGLHNIEIANREDGLNIDKIAILDVNSPTPTANGEPAYNCRIPVYFEPECRDGAFGAYQWDKKAKTGYSGTGYLESPTTSLTASSSTDIATYTFESGAGAFNFYFRIHNNQSADDDSFFYRIDGGSWVTVNNTNTLGSGWRWALGSSPTLTHGFHTLEIRNRENGLSLDKFAYVPTSVTGPSGTSSGSAAVNCEPFQTMSDWTYIEVAEYYDTFLNYIVSEGPHMLEHHVEWHDLNGSGGDGGTGSGVAFLGFHRAMQNDFRRFALENNGRSWLPVSTVGYVLPGVPDARQPLESIGLSQHYSPRGNPYVQDIGIPGFLTTTGPNQPIVFNNVTYNKLGDFTSLDVLGQVIGLNYHALLHNAIGGTFGGWHSPADPIFNGWHGLLDKIVDNWLNTPNGIAWAAANPNHPFLVQGFTSMHGWDNADFD